MKIAISTESTVDLSKELIKKYNINIVPFTVLLGNISYLDGEISPTEIIEQTNKTGVLPKTSAVNEFQYEEYFGNLLKDNDAVIHFTLSKEMSSAYNNAVNASQKLKNVYVIDSKTLSTGIALLAIYASKLVNKGLPIDKIIEKVNNRIGYVQASFVLKRLDYLYKGGRCSGLAFYGANILKIRPQIVVKNGKMKLGKKYRGNFERIVESYVDDTLKEFSNPDREEIFITYTTADEKMINSVRDKLIERGFKNVNVTTAGGTITSHCGENCFGILFINDGEKFVD